MTMPKSRSIWAYIDQLLGESSFIPPSSIMTRRWHHEVMPDEDEKPSVVAEEIALKPADSPVVLNEASLVLAEPETLIQGLRFLQKRRT
jgi:hypothetical protein